MKQIKFLVAVCMAAFFISCNQGEEKKAEPQAADTVAAPQPEPAPVPKLQNVMIIRHKVANFAKWLPLYESHDSVRNANGLSTHNIGRGTEDSNMVIVILDMKDVAKAKELAASPGLKERMEKAGVVGKPEISFLKVVMNDSSKIPQTARVIVTNKVKDWDTWKKVFDGDKQARMNAGLIDRGLGYSVDDNHMVEIVMAITDMEKAKAFAGSKELKDKMTEAGVEGPPVMMFYNIVKSY